MRSLVVFAGGEDLAWGRMPGYPNRALAAGGGDPAWYDWRAAEGRGGKMEG